MANITLKELAEKYIFELKKELATVIDLAEDEGECDTERLGDLIEMFFDDKKVSDLDSLERTKALYEAGLYLQDE